MGKLQSLFFVAVTLAGLTGARGAGSTTTYPDIRVENGSKTSLARINLGSKPTLSVETGNAPERLVPLTSQDLRSFTRLTEKLKGLKTYDKALCKGQLVQLTFEDNKPRTYCTEMRNSSGLAARTLVRRLDLALKIRGKPAKKLKPAKPAVVPKVHKKSR